MTDDYNYAYDHTQENSYENSYAVADPPSYDMSVIKQQQTPMPKPTVSSMDSESSPNTAKHIDVERSSGDLRIPLCRIFLIIVASIIFGGAIGGTISYLATRQGSQYPVYPTCPTCKTCPIISATVTGIAEDSSEKAITASQSPVNPTCPACQTCPTMSEPGIAEDSSEKDITASQSPVNPTCPACQTCPTMSEPDFPMNCQEVMDRGNMASGEYMISPLNTKTASREAFPVWCDMETDGGGWTVFQRRKDGSVDFFLGWSDYTNGFGDVNSEHWLGNQKIHEITSQGNYELRIDMADFEGNNAYAKYSSFKVGGLDTNYVLTVGGYSGDAGDSLTQHNNQPFTTKDVDNDSYGTNCASQFEGAWWYHSCHGSNLNGRYLRGSTTSYANGVTWSAWKGQVYSLKVSVMKMRRLT